ncbi:conserved hypothetical protein [Ricinus communis]|uniref:Uncharacterized protein n=1 Tax=Ricinus communis TaxID=3988 RepID=B9SKS4_RICCO|nr:conserved hypothetical protein [Ricinus communis]
MNAMLDTGVSHNFIDVQEAKRLNLKILKENSKIKVMNSEEKPSIGNSTWSSNPSRRLAWRARLLCDVH